MIRSTLGLIAFAFAVFVAAVPAGAEWQFRQGPTEVIGPDYAMGISVGAQTLNVFCLDGVETVMAWGYPAVPGEDATGRLTISVSGTDFVVDARSVPADGYWWGSAPTGLIEALRRGAQAQIAPPGTERIAIDLSGSSRAIDAALANCAGQAVAQANDDGADALFGGRASVEAAIAAACQGAYVLDERAILTGLIDLDEVPDLVLDWAGVTCQSDAFGRGAGNCGINMCQISVFLSAQEGAIVLGLAPELIMDAFGRARLRTIALRPSCPNEALDCVVLWQLTSNGLDALHADN